MAAGLYGFDETFTTWMDMGFRLMAEDGPRLRRQWLAEAPSPMYDDVSVAQPLLYMVNHALGRMLFDWGVTPVAMLGHSVGEFAAATLAGVLDFAEGMRLIRDRVEHFADTPPGGMLAVAAGVEEISDLLGGKVALAAVNARRQLLLAGDRDSLAEASRALDARGIVNRDVAARQAFHSPLVDGAVRAGLPGFRRVRLNLPRLKVYSAYTQDVLSDGEAVDPEFWASQAARTVYFAPTLDTLLDDVDCVLLEAGPGDGLSRLARRQPQVLAGRSSVMSLLPDRWRGDEVDRRSAAAARSLLCPGPVLTGAGGTGV